jgi:hypothetical protein
MSMSSEGKTMVENAAFQDTDEAEAITVLAALRHCANSWDGSARLVGNVRARDIARACSAAIEALAEIERLRADILPWWANPAQRS